MNKSMALMFEWHWQHPSRSLVLKEAARAVKHQGRGPHGKLLLLNALLGDKMWAQCELSVNFVEDEGFRSFVKLEQRRLLFHPIKMQRNEPEDLDALTRLEPSFIEAINLAMSGIDVTGDEITCAICKEWVQASKDKYLWCCSKCGATQHVLCSASAAMKSEQKNNAPRTKSFIPDAYTCFGCQDSISRMKAARMTFSPQFLLADGGDVDTIKRLPGHKLGDVHEAIDSDTKIWDYRENLENEEDEGKSWGDEGLSILEDGDSYLDNTWSQCDAVESAYKDNKNDLAT